MSIKRDFERGTKGENMVSRLLGMAGVPCWSVATEAGSSHDLEFSFCSTSEVFTIEVKNDEMAERTGNLAIEVWNSYRNEPSGLTATKADLWVQIVGDAVYVANVAELRAWVDANGHTARYISRAGNRNATILLFNAYTILEAVFSRIDGLDSRTLMGTLEDMVCCPLV